MRTLSGIAAVCVLACAAYGLNGFVTNVVDSRGDVGWYASMAIDANNNPVLAYKSRTGDCLKFATVYDGRSVVETVEDSNGRGYFCKVAVSEWGDIGIAHVGDSNAYFSVKSSWYGWATSGGLFNLSHPPFHTLPSNWKPIDFEYDGEIPHIAYTFYPGVCEAVFDVQSASWLSRVIDSDSGWPCLAVKNGREILGYYSNTYGYPQIFICEKTAYGEDLLGVFDVNSQYYDLAFNSEGEPVVAYVLGNALYYSQHTILGWTWGERVCDFNEQPQGAFSMVYGPSGPVIAYRETGTNDIILATNIAGWRNTIVDCNQSALYVNAAVDRDGKVYVSWFDYPNRCVKIAGMGMTQTCPADYNNDGIVNNIDLAILIGTWGASTENGITEMDGKAVIDERDLADFCGYWLWQRGSEI